MRWVEVLFCGALAGCRFDLPQLSEEMTDARLCFGEGLGKLCLTSPPAAELNLITGTIVTDTDGRCLVMDIGGISVCVLAGTTVSINSGTAVRGTGTRPLVIVASGTLKISGELDAGSQRGGMSGPGAQTTACAGMLAANADSGGGGGGAGGSFGGMGADGGTGDLDGNGSPSGANAGKAAPAFTPTQLRAGCPGGAGGIGIGTSKGGAGGLGGGAVYLIAGVEIQIDGRVKAYAGGGGGGDANGAVTGGGGGGGGSGGMIGIDAPAVTISSTAFITANGGGGGEGAGNGLGKDGGDGSTDGTRASGGSGDQPDGGDGGLGSGLVPTGDIGAPGKDGGGGGGGGAGYIYVKGTFTNPGAVVSPAATIEP